MMIAQETQDLLGALTPALPGVQVHMVADDGTVQASFGDGAPPRFEPGPGAPRAVRPGCEQLTIPFPDGHLVALFPAGAASVRDALQHMLNNAAQRERLERDMESVNASSLQLLEQVAMVGETMPQLSTCQSEAEVAAMGLRALVVAAGVERAAFLAYHHETQLFEVLVYMQMGADAKPEITDYPLAPVVTADRGMLAAIVTSRSSVVMFDAASVHAEHDLPEALGSRQVLGVPVCYGDGDAKVLLGVIVVADKELGGFTASYSLGSEEQQVAMSYGAMLGAVLGARKTAELGKELSTAQAIQAQVLPEAAPMVPGFAIAGDYRTCGEVGGDYFDFVPMADGSIATVIADVSGHNLASGMMMVSVRAMLRTLAGRHSSIGSLFAEVARDMHRDLTRTERFITAAGVTLRPEQGRVHVVNAGHNDTFLYRAAERQVHRLAGDGVIFGFVPSPEYRGLELELQPGDVILLFTDGITETTDAHGEMFGEDRLAAVLLQNARRPAAAIVDAVLSAVQIYRGGRKRADDLTAVAIQFLGGEK